MTKPVPSATMSALLSGITSLSSPEMLPSCRVLAYRESIPLGLSGSYVGLTSETRSLQVGLLSDILGWQSLTRSADSVEAPARDEVVEGACGLATAAAQALSAELAGGEALRLGLPLFVDGSVIAGADMDLQAADIVLGSTRALLVLLTPRSASQSVEGAERPSSRTASATQVGGSNQ